MLDQIIYTRCSKHRSLENGGREENQDGSTVYSMSESIFSNYTKDELGFVEKILRKPNASSEKEPIGLLTSYEYYRTPDGNAVVSRSDGRPMCTEKRKNGAANRGGTIINQAYLGEVKGYPFEMIGSPDWTAIQKSEIEYYHDNADEKVPYLPSLNRDMKGGDITADGVRNFLNANRKDAYKKALYFLMQEFSKNENERRVLLIKDTPQNVGLWIAALSLAMSTAMAQKLTFSTNKTSLGMQTDAQLFYYTDESGKLYYSANQNPNLKRKPYYMVAGYHSLDRFSKGLREFPNSHYVILDGDTLTFGIDSSFSVPESIYFQDAGDLSMDMNYFCDVILDNYSVSEFTDRIPDLYEAYCYLLTDKVSVKAWEYSKVLKYLKIINSFAKSRDVSFEEKIFSGIMQIYPTDFNEDENNGYALIRELSKIADTPDRQEQIRRALVEKLVLALKGMEKGDDRIVGTWKTIRDNNIGIDIRNLLCDVLNDHYLKEITDHINRASQVSVNAVLDMYIYMIENGVYSYRITCENQTKYAFVLTAFDCIKESDTYLVPLLKRISGSKELLSAILYAVENADKNRNTSVFMQALVKTCPDIFGVVNLFSRYKGASFGVVDNLLKVSILENRRCDGALLECYRNAFQIINPVHYNTSEVFNTWLSILEPNDLGRFFREVHRFGFNMQLKEQFIESADNKLKFDEVIHLDGAVIDEIAAVANAIDIYSRTEEIYNLFSAVKQARKADDLIGVMEEFTDAKIVFPEAEKKSKFIQTVFQALSGFKDEEMHFRALCLFSFDHAASRDSYIRQYVKAVLGCTKKNQILDQIASLSQVASQIENQSKDSRGLAMVWETILVEELVPYYKSSMSEQVKKMSYEETIEKNTLVLLKKVQDKAPKGLGGKINSFIGKWKK
ncbi:MAG: hypothetical protein LUH14_06935 [Clostridiaceae bacterium]|nr:hypothetical protein [Clostridiaceae bacterium]